MKTVAERISDRMREKRLMTSISLRIPERVVDDLKEIAPTLGFSGYQGLIKAYISQGLRRDLERLVGSNMQALTESLREQGVTDDVISKAMTQADMRKYTGDVMENPLAIRAENLINLILTGSSFLARAKNLGIGFPQIEVTNHKFAASNNVKLEHFFVTLSETDQLRSDADLREHVTKLLFESAETLTEPSSRKEFSVLRSKMNPLLLAS
jgi:hypothetical protein